MSRYNLLFESSPWLTGIGVLLGVLYAAGLYYKFKGPWSKNMNRLLAVLRFLLVTQLTVLLFGPLIRMIKNTYENPAVVLAIDNSTSVSDVFDSLRRADFSKKLEKLRQDLEAAGYTTGIRTLQSPAPVSSITQVRFTAKSTDLYSLLNSIKNDYESRNLAEVILVSDGLFNRGMNPVYFDFPFRIYTVGMGDTVRHPDVNLNALLYNKIAYQGNKFPLIAEVITTGLNGRTIPVTISNKGKVIASKNIPVNRDEQFERVRFLLEAKDEGIQRYVVKAGPVDGEFTVTNNTKEAYIDIIEGKLKILIAAPAPHPDIKALRSAIEKNRNYEVIRYIPGMDHYKKEKYDAAILHGVPDRKHQFGTLLDIVKNEQIPVWFIVGRQTDLRKFSRFNGLVRFQSFTDHVDEVFPLYNKDFKIFNYPAAYGKKLGVYPPVTVPFTKMNVRPGAEILLYQKIGNISTTKPLLVLYRQNEMKRAVLLGEGIWKWRLQEYARDKNFEAFDELVSKVIQFLATKGDKRRFRVYPVKNEFISNEPVIFEAEIYNEIYENIYGYKIDLTIKNENGETTGYSFVTSENNSKYRINGLGNGIYTYQARSNVNGKNMTAKGRFTIKDLQIESTRLRADFDLLQALAQNTHGKFYTVDNLSGLEQQLLKEKPMNKIYSSEDYLAIINMKWGFFILILLASVEWFLRKYYGSY